MRSYRAKGRSPPSLGVRGRHVGFPFLGEDTMLEALGIALVALAFVAFLVLIGRSFLSAVLARH
jgi:hypothetical protein